MPASVTILDEDLIRQIEEEQEIRGDSAPSKTANKLLVERLTELRIERRKDTPSQNDKPAASVPQASPSVG